MGVGYRATDAWQLVSCASVRSARTHMRRMRQDRQGVKAGTSSMTSLGAVPTRVGGTTEVPHQDVGANESGHRRLAARPSAGRVRLAVRVGTAYRIRTGDLRLERAVSWASRRMRRGAGRNVRPATENSRTGADPATWTGVRGGGSRGRPGASRRPADSPALRAPGRSGNGPRTARTVPQASRRGVRHPAPAPGGPGHRR